ncbi:AMP-binding protein [Pedobacter sp. HMF7647]|uniref:AMP-binding protein n=1 Tax=Hufsiella arboris TaxID=2695275 RepID=A0A7K1Y8P3_9SPHI|nr:long-chain fatty acid--CoA ligase [Hufsiella arboris]MXV50964.1 AMP-binding protein [Hufsiella arboris]
MSSVTRVFDLLDHSRQKFNKEDIVCWKDKNVWFKYTTADFISVVDQISRGLIALGIKKNEKVGVMSGNRPEWNICDFAIMQIGATQVPMYPTLSNTDIKFILNDAGVKIVFASNKELADKIAPVCSETSVKIFTFDTVEGYANYSEVIELGKNHESTNLQTFRDNVTPDDLLTLIYTSGTTGTPKGVMLTHNNLVSNFTICSKLFPEGYNKALSFLPLSHIFERMVVYMYFYLGISVYYAESTDTIVADMNEVNPHGFTTVPRLLEKVYDKIVAKGNEQTGIKRKIFFWALKLGLNYEFDGKNGWWYELQLSLANKLVFTKWREALGGNIKAIISGGAALQPRLARVFWAAKIPILEGYGLTETSPVIAVNGFGATKFGTVGKPINNVEVKIAEDGEIMFKGPNLMKGYYNRPDLTADIFDQDGFYHTGDIGELSADGYLCITDRKKEMFKTAGGKYIAPQMLENKYKECPLIEQVMVVGENRRFPSALIVPSFEALSKWCELHGFAFSSKEEMIKDSHVIEKYQQEINKYNQGFGHWEQVKKFALLPKEWSIESGEMTPKLSFKRKVILEKNKDIVDQIYNDPRHVEVP